MLSLQHRKMKLFTNNHKYLIDELAKCWLNGVHILSMSHLESWERSGFLVHLPLVWPYSPLLI